MKNLFKFVGIIAAVAVIGFAVVSCSDGGSSGFKAPGLLKVPSVAGIPDYTTGTTVGSYTAAKALLSNFGNFFDDSYGEFEPIATAKAKATYTSSTSFWTDNAQKTSAKQSFKYAGVGATTTTASVDGSYEKGLTTNMTLAEFGVIYGISPFAAGDTYSSTDKQKITFVTGATAVGSDLVLGTVIFEKNNSEKTSYQAIKEDETEIVEVSDGKGTMKASFAVSIDDGTNAAKFCFAVSTNSKDKQAKAVGGSNNSDVLVYNNAGELLYTIPAEEAEGIVSDILDDLDSAWDVDYIENTLW